MFDDLDDPNPPVAGMHTLANVTERARQIRRRRLAWVGATAAALLVGSTAGALVATNNDDGNRTNIVNLAPESTDETVPPSSTAQTLLPDASVSTSTPDSGLDVPTTAPEAITTALPAPSTEAAVVPTAVPEPTTTTPAPTTSAVAPAFRPIVAIDGNGDAVIVNRDSTTTLLYEGTDPDDPPPTEGELVVVDAVAVTDDLSVAFVGTCCEPIPGSILRLQNANASAFDVYFGHAPAISPDGTKVAIDALGTVSVNDLGLTNFASTPDDFLGAGSGLGFVWIDNNRFVVLTAEPEISRLQSITLAADQTLQGGPVWTSERIDGFSLSLAGLGDGVIYVRGLAPSTLTAFDSTTLRPLPTADIALPGDPLSAWMQNGELRWVDQGRTLHVGDTIIPGEFIWVH